MLLKLFRSRTNNTDPDANPNPNPTPIVREVAVREKPSVLQIIHAGGVVERYYMAFPAASIMEKHPNSVLARPEIFRRPWDSIVQPEEILVPGQKYFVVPVGTVKKLRRRMWKPSHEMSNCLVFQDKDTPSSKSLLFGKPISFNRRVRFKGIESKTRNDSGGKKSSNGRGSRKKIVRFAPSLTVIDETQDFDD
ncbi:hypothetical protein L2E82_02183 [Cichorium intybus]|uniref:Uncharacterized protein n=1 Tax=Cichorium intybus TaxID=13427 RepID=A0ACB9H0Y1_CICIN|nr:hypothetical protein L2E82_02183 [Cichorium intybus]